MLDNKRRSCDISPKLIFYTVSGTFGHHFYLKCWNWCTQIGGGQVKLCSLATVVTVSLCPWKSQSWLHWTGLCWNVYRAGVFGVCGEQGELDSKHDSEIEASLTEAASNILQQTWLAPKRPVCFPLTIGSEHSAWGWKLMEGNSFFAKPYQSAVVHWGMWCGWMPLQCGWRMGCQARGASHCRVTYFPCNAGKCWVW